MGKAFETWRHGGIKFLAVFGPRHVHVLDEFGNNYGSWLTVDDFRDRQRRGEVRPIGQARLLVSPVPSPAEEDMR